MMNINRHPLEIIKEENKALIDLLVNIRKNFNALPMPAAIPNFHKGLMSLKGIEKHYRKKEELIFPLMIDNGTIEPPKVMKGVHDEIREKFVQVDEIMSRHALSELKIELPKLLDQIEDMINKEEDIMIPMVKSIIGEKEATNISEQFLSIGYFLID